MIFRHNEQVSTRSGWYRLMWMVIPVVLLFSVASYIAVDRWYNNNLQPLSSSESKDVIVVIEEGSSVRDIGDQLKNLGVIRNSTVFSWYVGRENLRGELQAGTYRLNPSQSVQEIAEQIAGGDIDTSLFTVLPGKRLDELEQLFLDFGYSESEVAQAFSARYDHPLLNARPKNASLEGYIFPETYAIHSDTSPQEIVNRSFDQFNSLITDEIRAGIKKQGLNLHEAIILASVVQRESSSPEVQPRIAQVFLNRLEQGMNLGADATFYYAAAITGEEPSPAIDNPYNTRVYGGLPPGPISNFNINALKAVAKPSGEDFLFFVSGDNGKTYFSKTQEEHDALTLKYCDKNCQIQQ